MFIGTCECGTRVYSTRTGPGYDRVFSVRCCATVYSLPGWGVRSKIILELMRYIFRVCTCGTVFSLDSPSSVSCMCTCVCTAVGMGSPSVVSLVVRTCMRLMYSIRHGQPEWRA